MLVLYLFSICLLATHVAASNLYGDEIIKPSVVACAAVTCQVGQHCEERNGQVSCVEDQLEPVSSCAGVVCNAPDTVCVEENGPSCVPIGETGATSTQETTVSTCAETVCDAPDTVCVEENGPRCVPIAELGATSTQETTEGVTDVVEIVESTTEDMSSTTFLPSQFRPRATSSPCALIRCRAGFHCEENNGHAACVQDQTEQGITCASLICMENTKCVEESGQATCAPLEGTKEITLETEESGYDGAEDNGATPIRLTALLGSSGRAKGKGGSVSEILSANEQNEYGNQPNQITGCAVLQCQDGTECEEDNGQAKCVPTIIRSISTLELPVVDNVRLGGPRITTAAVGRGSYATRQNAYGDESIIPAGQIVCGPNEVASPCGWELSCEPTCDNMFPHCPLILCAANVTPKCVCDSGNDYVKDETTQQCVKSTECPVKGGPNPLTSDVESTTVENMVTVAHPPGRILALLGGGRIRVRR